MRVRATILLVLAAAIAAALLIAPAGTRSAPVVRESAHRPAAKLTRYSLAHGCYTLRTASGRLVGPVRMQPAALDEYVLYDTAGRYLGPGLSPLTNASNLTVWRVNHHFTLTNRGMGQSIAVSFVPAGGCLVFPEAQSDAFGTPFTGPGAAASVLGTVEGHAHVTAYELFGGDWHCGRPWSPFGVTYALPASCASKQQGTNGEFEAFLDFGGATRPADFHGWPTFVHWPSPTAVAEEGDYWTAIERAWKAGLRVMVTNDVDNEALCQLMTTIQHACNDMVSTRIQSRDLHEIEDYVDAQAGGPGKGFFRLVTDPFQARQVINEGKLAVIQGIEVSRVFGCGEMNGVPQCDRAQIDAGLKEVRSLGVRTFFPVHEFNNAFGGSKMIGGESGAIINAGNRSTTGSFFTLAPCPAQDQDSPQLTFPATGGLAALLNGPAAKLLGGNPLPIYPPGPQCNTQGLTALGAYVINKMIDQHMIIQLDHMDSKTATAALAIATSRHYAGVVSAHCCASPQLFSRIYATGGFVNASKDTVAAFANILEQDKAQRSPRFAFGFGYGSDMNGLSAQTGPDPVHSIHYPFKSYLGDVTFTRETWGQRVFNFNTDGIADYGQYADWLQALQQAGGHSVMNDMFHGAEAYLEMWERASGVPVEHCLSVAGARRIKRGQTFQTVLYGAGQPVSRPGLSYRYCLAGHQRGLTVHFDRQGRVARVLGLS